MTSLPNNQITIKLKLVEEVIQTSNGKDTRN